jgi:type VI secretion system protein ImpG
VPDQRKERTTEVHSILSVTGSSEYKERVREYAPFYSFTHQMGIREQKVFWHARRLPVMNEDLTGTDVMLSFRDADFKPAQASDEVVFAHLLCTNRALATQLPAGALMQTDDAIPVARIVCLKKPTVPLDPPLGGQALWRLVSHLSLNYLSLDEKRESLKALREILTLYCFSDAPSLHQQILGIESMVQRQIVRRLGASDWKGFCRGSEVTLTMDENLYVGSSALVLGAVLSRFLGLYASTNSFTQLVIKRAQREGEWKRWPPMAGGRTVL